MSSAMIPLQIAFELDATESIQIRKNLFGANGGRLIIPIFVANAILVVAQAALRLYRHDWFGWPLLALAIIYVAFCVPVFSGWWAWQRALLKQRVATVVSFNDKGIEIQRGDASAKRVTRLVPFAAIRSVRMASDALIIMGRWRPIVFIPKRAIADEGDQLMRFFEAHLVGTRFLRRSSTSGTMIVNTVTP